MCQTAANDTAWIDMNEEVTPPTLLPKSLFKHALLYLVDINIFIIGEQVHSGDNVQLNEFTCNNCIFIYRQFSCATYYITAVVEYRSLIRGFLTEVSIAYPQFVAIPLLHNPYKNT